MSAKVVVKLDNRPDGSDVRIPGLGVFKNGGTYTVDDRVWRRFRAVNPGYPEDHTFNYSTEEHERRAKEATTGDEPLEEQTVDELRDQAASEDIPGRSDMNKSELIDALEGDEA